LAEYELNDETDEWEIYFTVGHKTYAVPTSVHAMYLECVCVPKTVTLGLSITQFYLLFVAKHQMSL